jgi:hypothetical protein
MYKGFNNVYVFDNRLYVYILLFILTLIKFRILFITFKCFNFKI